MSSRFQNILAAVAVIAIAAISSLPQLVERPAAPQPQVVAEAQTMTTVSFSR